MYVFIATIFIAELIIVGFIINLLVKCDKKVICLNSYISNCGKDILQSVKNVHSIFTSLQGVIGNITGFFEKKKRDFRIKIINLVLIYALLIVFRLRFIKAAAILQYALLLKDFWASIPA